MSMRRSAVVVVLLLAGVLAATGQVKFTNPPPGSVYKEFVMVLNGDDRYTVVDPNLDLVRYPQAASQVPPPKIPITIDDLSGSVRAEALICFWGGHVSTYGDAIQFNDNAWIPLPVMDTSNGIPSGHMGYNYLQEENIVVNIPLAHLHTGSNFFQGTNAGQKSAADGGYGFGWGQWAWYGMVVRVYYDSTSKAHAAGYISSPSTNGNLGENPTVAATITSGSPAKVEFFAYYDGYDTDGDGIYKEYHHDYNFDKYQATLMTHNHVGTTTSSPWSVTWNTTWVPDQDAGIIKMMARIQSSDGTWYVTPEVTNLSLMRTGKSVKLYKSYDVPERCWAKGDVGQQDLHVNIPASDNLANISAAQYYIRTWNGINSEVDSGSTDTRRVNSYGESAYGADHNYSFDTRSLPTWVPVSGANDFFFDITTEKTHGVEILWPGPALSVAYAGSGYASPVPAVAVLASPASGAMNQSVSLTLKWHPAAAASTYDLQVSTDAGFGSTVVSRTGLTDTTSAIGPLTANTTYYWRVRAINTAGNGAYTAAFSFSTNVGVPTLKSPANNALSQATSIVLGWNAIATATQYHIQVATDSGFGSSNIVKDTTRTDTTQALSGLAYATKYYWRVAAQTSGAWGNYSAVWAFTTTMAPAAVPTLVSPVNNAIDQLTTLTLRWHAAASAESYYLQAGTDSNFVSGLIANDSTLVDTTKAFTSLPYNTKYYWRVRSKNGVSTSAFTPVWNFRTVMSVPVGPSLVYPANAALGQPTAGLTFIWGSISSATYYRFQLATDSTFASGIIKNDSMVVDTFRVVSGLSQSSKYFWRVLGRNAGGSGPFSSTYSFYTIVPVPGAVTPVSPAQLATVGADSAMFRWNRTSPAATKYWFQIAVDSNFVLFTSTDSTLTDTTKTFRPLINTTRYYWRVRGGNSGGWGAYSPTQAFNVVISSVPQEHGVPGDYTLRQNYPNPFNPTTEITFGIPRESRVKVEVYNLLGETVAVLVDEVLSAGYHTTRLSADGLPSGMYLYRMSAGDVTLTKKMLLVR
jgi:hypothetical protein